MEKKVVFNSVCVSCLWKNDGVSGKVKSHPRRIRNDVCGGVLKAIIEHENSFSLFVLSQFTCSVYSNDITLEMHIMTFLLVVRTI